MLKIFYRGARPGPDWHRHGTTSKTLQTLVDGGLGTIIVLKQRWLHVPTGRTCHARPVWDSPNSRYSLDVVVLTLYAWLLSSQGLLCTSWPWSDEECPARRSVQRWAARLAGHASDWLACSRRRLIEYVAPRSLEELLPTGGIPPPTGARMCNSLGDVVTGFALRDTVWLLKHIAQALSIPLRKLLIVARWRWPRSIRTQSPQESP